MSFVFRHPSLTAIEILWRWCAAAPLLYLGGHTLAPPLEAIPLNSAALQSMTFFEPVRSVGVLARQLLPFRSPLVETGKWWIPLALIVWTAAATLGRTALLRRADRLWSGRLSTQPVSPPETPSSPPEQRGVQRSAARCASARSSSLSASLAQTALFTLVRTLGLWLVLALWAFGFLAAVRSTITHHIYAGVDPDLVLLTAETVGLTLAAFLLWSAVVWRLDVQLPQAVTGLGPQTDPQRRELRSKLIETNLVMGIVRVILFVLALTFSASPLPFQSQETQAFINVWWIGVAAFYLLGSDFFHVVRRVTYLRLLETIAPQTTDQANAGTRHAS